MFTATFLDNWVGYTTKKAVYIRDRWLGFIYYGLVFAVLMYIFGYQMLVHNEQFNLSPVHGIPRIKVTHPTVDDCDPKHASCKSAYRSLHALSYCTAYSGKEPASHQGACRFRDFTSINPHGDVDNKMFIPTAVEIVTEKKSCKPSVENGYTCENEYEELPGSDCLKGEYMCQTRGGLKDQFYYVADTKNFRVQFTSSYEGFGNTGTSLDHPAYYELCPARVRGANMVRNWSTRLEHREMSDSECRGRHKRIVKVPCAEGVDCAERSAFDILHSTGVGKTVEKAKRHLRDLPKKMIPPKESIQDTSSLSSLDHRVKSRKGIRRLSNGALYEKASFHGQHQLKTEHMGSVEAVASKRSFSDDVHYDPLDPNNTDQIAGRFGDIFKLSRLMELAGADLDRSFNDDGWSTRESGTVLEVSVVYGNMHPFISSFGYKEVNYHYRVRELPLPYVSRTQLAEVQPPDFPETRRYEVQHGIMIWFKVTGDFGMFDQTYFLIYLVTAFALISVATTITDLLAVYVHDRKENYFKLKYDVSEEFSTKWQCAKCGFWNSQFAKSCENFEMWQNKKEVPQCGEPKPESND